MANGLVPAEPTPGRVAETSATRRGHLSVVPDAARDVPASAADLPNRLVCAFCSSELVDVESCRPFAARRSTWADICEGADGHSPTHAPLAAGDLVVALVDQVGYTGRSRRVTCYARAGAQGRIQGVHAGPAFGPTWKVRVQFGRHSLWCDLHELSAPKN